MRKCVISAVTAAAALAVMAGPVLAEKVDGAAHGGRLFTATMTGAAEVPGPGDPDGTGTALLTVNRGQQEICFELSVFGIAAATATHIHVAPAGVAGPVVVPLTPPTAGTSSGCRDVNLELIDAIRKNPENYYVNVHNADFPGGALRGQISG